MGNTKQLRRLRAGVTEWNQWRNENLGMRIDLYRADLRGADLHGANLSGADLHGANLSGADLRGADLHEANLRGADLHEANLRGANLSRADLRGTNLSGADLTHADLYGANLSGSDLRGTNLSGADLIHADLYGANLNNTVGYASLPNRDLHYGRSSWLTVIDGEIVARIGCMNVPQCSAYEKMEAYNFEEHGLSAADYAWLAEYVIRCRLDDDGRIIPPDLPSWQTDPQEKHV